MILLEFFIDTEELQGSLGTNLRTNGELIPVTLFLMPVRWHIHGVELFEYSSLVVDTLRFPNPWTQTPIVHLAIFGLEHLELAHRQPHTKQAIDLSGFNVYVVVEDDQVTMSTNINKKVIIANYQEVRQSLLDFGSQVRKLLTYVAPEIKENDVWGEWFRQP